MVPRRNDIGHDRVDSSRRVRRGPIGNTDAVPDPLLDRPSWAPAWLPSIDDDRQVKIFRWVLYVVFTAGLMACVTEGANSPADPELGAAPTPSELAARFGTIMVDIVTGTADVLELCLLHADVAPERSQGLMQVSDLEGHDGMLFSNEGSVESPYIMVNTVMPLTITWWQDGGGFRSTTDMVPCTEADTAACTRYTATGPYRYAIEVPQGALGSAGIDESARLQIGSEGCTPS